MEAIAHVPSQAAFAQKIAGLLRPGGAVILTTQNPAVWGRASWIEQHPAHRRDWPTPARLVALFSPYFDLEPIRTISPGAIADRGLWPRLLTNRLSDRLGSSVMGRARWRETRERLGCGCSLLLVARKRD
jgi:hypothetical protein